MKERSNKNIGINSSFFLLLIFCFFSCWNNQAERDFTNSLINDIFLQIISADNYFPYFPPPPPPQSLDKFGQISTDSCKFKEYKDLISRVDTNRNVFSIEDSTVSIKNIDYVIASLKSEKKYKYFDSLSIIESESSKNKIPIEINRIKNTGKYELIKRSSILPKEYKYKSSRDLNWSFYYFGNLLFSKPIIDKSGRFGFLTFTLQCGFECDRTYIVIFEKKNNKWIVTNRL